MTTREQAIKWWNTLPKKLLQQYTIEQVKFVRGLTGREIELLWDKYAGKTLISPLSDK